MNRCLAIVLVFVVACSSMGDTKPLALELSELEISLDVPGSVERSFRVCKRKGLFGKENCVLEYERFDLNKKEDREKLFNMGFVLVVRDRVVQ